MRSQQADVEQDGATLTEVITSCIEVLLKSLEVRIADRLHDNPDEMIGNVRIIVDGRGIIGARVKQQGQAPKCGTFFMCVDTATEGYVMEFMLAQWACNTSRIATAIKVLEPKYADPDWEEDLSIASDEVAEVLLNAVVITPGSPMHTYLHRATRAVYC